MKQAELLGGLLGDGSVWRLKSLAEHGVTAATVRRALAAGLVEQVSRGVYRAASVVRVADQELAELSARVSGCLVCLHSAADFHGLGDMASSRIWAALPARRRTPNVEWPPVRFVHWSVRTRFEVGVETRSIAGVQVAMTDLARTVVDMVACKALVGEERALQCLRDYVARGEPVAALSKVAEQVGWASRVAPYLLSASVFGGPR